MVEKLDAFLRFNEYDILNHAGRVSHEVAKALAEDEYEKFRVIADRNYESDFERAASRTINNAKSARSPRSAKKGEPE